MEVLITALWNKQNYKRNEFHTGNYTEMNKLLVINEINVQYSFLILVASLYFYPCV